jgi:hypothetical protein
MKVPLGFIPPHGNYRQLQSYRKAEIVYDLTYRFCQRFLSQRDRTVDQMIQAARSGKQNIVEGSKASGTTWSINKFAPWNGPLSWKADSGNE